MPDTTIGRHAVQHIEQDLEWHERRARFIASRPSAPGPHVAEMEHGLRQILETGLPAAFNVGLRGIADTQEIGPGAARMPRRLLLGSHDVEAFTAKMARWPAVRELAAALAASGLARPTRSARWPRGDCSGLPRVAGPAECPEIGWVG